MNENLEKLNDAKPGRAATGRCVNQVEQSGAAAWFGRYAAASSARCADSPSRILPQPSRAAVEPLR